MPSGRYKIKEIDNTIIFLITGDFKTDNIMKDITMKSVMTIHSNRNELLKLEESSFSSQFCDLKESECHVGIHTEEKLVIIIGVDKSF